MKNTLVLALILSSAITMGCQGKKGDSGAPGASSRITSTMNCAGTISGSNASLSGLQIVYNAVLTSNGDVYATAAVVNETTQASGTQFYAAGESGSNTAEVEITDDYVGTPNGAIWDISLNRQTLVTTVQYDDPSLANVIQLTFDPSACTVHNF
jgi:hypothetical protein